MTEKTDAAAKKQAAAENPSKRLREERQAEQLRANLARRKLQTRSRRLGAADQRPEGVAVEGEAGPTDDQEA